jgi:hypothetical protein
MTRRIEECTVQTRMGLFNTNQVNLAGSVFPIESLKAYLDQTWESGLPMFLSHDMHRPIGWSSGLGLLLCPQFSGVVGRIQMAESEKDIDDVRDAVRHYLARKFCDVPAEQEAQLRELIGDKAGDDMVILRRECVCAQGPGLAANLFPMLFNDVDKDGLTNLRNLKQVAPGVFEVDGLLLFAHQYFRRSQSRLNNLNGEFLELLGHAVADTRLVAKIALDPDLAGLPGTWKQYIELAYWWGPKFKASLPENQGVTRHEGNTDLKFFHGIRCTEFWWHNQDETKSFEAEEVREAPSLGLSDDHYACRYVHSMLDRTKHVPIHLDGAVRIYDTNMLVERLDQSIATAGKNTNYVKLWRIDGPIALDRWKALISHYYRDNRLIGEYLGGEDTVFIEQPKERSKRPLAKYLSYSLGETDGVLALVSYHPKTACPGMAPVEVFPWHKWEIHGRTESAIEFSAFDFIKLLKECHNPLALPSASLLIGYEDMDINLPLVVHRGPDAISHAAQSLACIQEFIAQLAQHGGDRFITAQLGIEHEHRIVTFSFAGLLRALALVMPKINSIPQNEEGILDWCVQTQSTLHNVFPGAKYEADDLEMIELMGALNLRRTMVPIGPGLDGEPVIAIPQNDTELIEAIRDRRISLAPCFNIKEAVCLVCQSSYLACPCKVILTGTGAVNVTESAPLGCTWTCRPAQDIVLNVDAAYAVTPSSHSKTVA